MYYLISDEFKCGIYFMGEKHAEQNKKARNLTIY